ncbi:MAG: hypothetical protein WAM11_05450 [Cyanobium sp.]
MAPPRRWAVRCAGCGCDEGTVAAFGMCSSGPVVSQKANLLLAHPSGDPVDEPWYLVSNAELALDLVRTYGQRFCCQQLFRDQKFTLFELESSGLRNRSASIGCCWSSLSPCW